jgi:hypothetical protein
LGYLKNIGRYKNVNVGQSGGLVTAQVVALHGELKQDVLRPFDRPDNGDDGPGVDSINQFRPEITDKTSSGSKKSVKLLIFMAFWVSLNLRPLSMILRFVFTITLIRVKC